jgi:hypothetical protein
VLRFFGYVEEQTGSSFRSSAASIVRKVIVYFFLADSTIKIVEPKNENSGIQCGVMVSRQKLSKTGRPVLWVAVEDDGAGDLFKPEDLYVGGTVTVRARRIHLVDCDDFTREYYDRELGLPLEEPLEYPQDPQAALDQGVRAAARSNKVPKPKHDTRKQFLDNEKKVLRFEAQWDDRKLYGEKRQFQLSYHLSNDQVEVREIRNASSGRSDTARLLKPRELPKQGCPGEFIRPKDLVCGEHVHVYGRDMLLVDCDDFTIDYYGNNHGNIVQRPARHLLSSDPEPPSMPEPPHTGYRFGSEEDSLQSHYMLNPSAPKKDVGKIRRLDNKVMRFRAKFANPQSEHDMLRRFLVAYHLEDDTLEIFEAAQRNATGQAGTGTTRFLARQKYRNVMGAGERGSQARGRYFDPTDFYLGAYIALEFSPQQQLELLEADAFTLKYCEVSCADGFPNSDVQAVITKLARAIESNQPDFDLRAFFRELDGGKSMGGRRGRNRSGGTISGDDLSERIYELGLVDLNRHELTTLSRRYRTNSKSNSSRSVGSADEVAYDELCDDVARHAARMQAMGRGGGGGGELKSALHKLRCCPDPNSIRRNLTERDKNSRGTASLNGFMLELQRRELLGADEQQLSEDEAYLVFDEAVAMARSAGDDAEEDSVGIGTLCDLIYCMPGGRGVGRGGGDGSGGDVSYEHGVEEDEGDEFGYFDQRVRQPRRSESQRGGERGENRRSAWGGDESSGASSSASSGVVQFFKEFFHGKKYELHSELRDRARRGTGKVNARAFMDALVAVKPGLTTERRAQLEAHFFPKQGDVIDYRRVMANALS